MYLGQKVAEKDPNNPHTFKMLMTINQKKRKKKLIFLNKMNFKKKKNPQPGTELFIWRRKLIVLVAFNSPSHIKVTKSGRLNSTSYFIRKILKKWEGQKITWNHFEDTDFEDKESY